MISYYSVKIHIPHLILNFFFHFFWGPETKVPCVFLPSNSYD